MVNIDPQRLSGVLMDLYAVAAEPSARTGLADRLARAFDSSSGLVHTRAPDPVGVTIVDATDNCAAFLPDYVSHYHALDAWAERGSAVVDSAVLGEELVPVEELRSSSWYNDLLRRHEIHHLVGAVFRVGDGTLGSIGLHRPADAAPFDAGDRALMNLAIPHLRQVLRLMRTADVGGRVAALGVEALGALQVGVFVVDAKGAVIFLNALASRLASAGLGLSLRRNRLALSTPSEHDRLQEAIFRSAMAPLGRSLSAGETIVPRTPDGGALPLFVTPLPPDLNGVGVGQPLAAVFVGDPAGATEPSLALVRSAYGLTAAEAKVAIAVARGRTPMDIAAEHRLSPQTVRVHLRTIFWKTGCHRQSELARLIAANPIFKLAGLTL